jgi:hypothetical protein
MDAAKTGLRNPGAAGQMPIAATASTTRSRWLRQQRGLQWGSGTDVARESPDLVLIGSYLSKFAQTLRIARRCRVVIHAITTLRRCWRSET